MRQTVNESGSAMGESKGLEDLHLITYDLVSIPGQFRSK
jgi:hypothetical protein